MKRLYLVRHAMSGWKNSRMADFRRPLNRQGVKEAGEMAECLFDKGLRPDLMVSSPAVRALSTARIFGNVFGYPESGIVQKGELSKEGAVEDIASVVRALPESTGSVLLFGHNPSISEFASWLGGEERESMVTCGVFCFDLKVSDWADVEKGAGAAGWYEVPENHCRKRAPRPPGS